MIGDVLGDFRGSLETAVAYRLHEMKPGLSAEACHKRVCDFAQYGMNSPYHKEVLEAIVDLYGPIISTIIPIARNILRVVVQETNSQNKRGKAAEASLDRSQG